MSETEKIHFKCETLAIVRELMKIFIEQYFDTDEGKKETDAHRFATFEFLKTMIDDELNSILHEFMKKEGYEEITFVNCEHDFISIFKIVHDSQKFRDLENDYIKKGHAGLGVFDKKTQKFYPCGLGEHWHMIRLVIKDCYPHLYEAFRRLTRFKDKNEFEGISRKELDAFILSNFLLISQSKELVDYLM